jgi:hypothetical protein
MARQCELIVGYLIPHRCEGKASSICTRCGRAVCDEHATIADSGIICVACHEEIEQPPLPAVAAVPPAAIYDSSDYAQFASGEDRGDLFAEMS